MDFLPVDSSLSSLYRQARVLSRPGGGRLRNPGWYRRADQQPVQWHLLVSGTGVVSKLFDASSGLWKEGPKLPELSLAPVEAEAKPGLAPASREALQTLARDLIQPYATERDSGLGVILHLADSLLIRKLAPEFEGESDLEGLDELLIVAPEKALGDKSVAGEPRAWRCLPLASAESDVPHGFGASLSDRFRCFVEELRDFGNSVGIPVAAEARSAALEMLALSPLVSGGFLDFPNEGRSLAVVRYPKQTVYAVLRPDGLPDLIRAMPRPLAPGQESADLTDLLRGLLASGDRPFSRLLFVDRFPHASQPVDLAPIAAALPGISCKLLSLGGSTAIPGVPEGIPEAGLSPDSSGNGATLADSAVLDFYRIPHRAALCIPGRADLRIARASVFFRAVLLVVLLAGGGALGFDMLAKLRSSDWGGSPVTVAEANAQLAGLLTEKKRWEAWNDILLNRSEGWLALELPLRLFPENGGILLQEFSYALESPVILKNRVGFTRHWKFSGFFDPEKARSLAALGSEREITKTLGEIATENLAPYLVEGGESTIDLSFQQRQAGMPDTGHFPTQFTRRFRNGFELDLQKRVAPDQPDSLPTLPRPPPAATGAKPAAARAAK